MMPKEEKEKLTEEVRLQPVPQDPSAPDPWRARLDQARELWRAAHEASDVTVEEQHQLSD